MLYFVGLAVNAYFVQPRAAHVGRVVRAHPGRQDDLPRDPRLHAVLSVLGPGQRPAARGAGASSGPGKVIGFVTAESDEMLRRSTPAGDDMVAVYLPMSYMVGGYTIFLPRELVETDVAVGRGRHAHRADGRRAQQRDARCAGGNRRRGAPDVQAVVIPGHAVRPELLAGLVPAHAGRRGDRPGRRPRQGARRGAASTA